MVSQISNDSNFSVPQTLEDKVQSIEVGLWRQFKAFASTRRYTFIEVPCPKSMNVFAVALIQMNNDKSLLDKIDPYMKNYQWISISTEPFLLTNFKLGNGSFGAVYRGFNLEGVPCAIKHGNFNPSEINFLNEVGRKGSKKSCVNLMFAGSYTDLALELGDSHLRTYLESLVAKAGSLSQSELKEIDIFNRSILSSLCEIKKYNVVHADIKDENFIVISRNGYRCIKLADFGLLMRSKYHWQGQGTPSCFSPEQYAKIINMKMKLSLPHQFDIWTSMLVLVQINQLVMSKPFAERANAFNQYLNEQLLKIESKHLPFEDQLALLSEAMICFFESEIKIGRDGIFDGLEPTTPIEASIQQMAKFDPTKRITAEKALCLYDGFVKPTINPGIEELHEHFELVDSDDVKPGCLSEEFQEIPLDSKDECKPDFLSKQFQDISLDQERFAADAHDCFYDHFESELPDGQAEDILSFKDNQTTGSWIDADGDFPVGLSI